MTTDTETKVCTRCHQECPIDQYPTRMTTRGMRVHRPICGACVKARAIAHERVTELARLLVESRTQTKTCQDCGLTFPIDHFRLHKGYWRGTCRACRNRYDLKRNAQRRRANSISDAELDEIALAARRATVRHELELDSGALPVSRVRRDGSGRLWQEIR